MSKRFLKLIIFFLNLAKKSVVINYIFKIDNYCHIPIQLMLAKYDTSFLRRTKKCTVISIMTPTCQSCSCVPTEIESRFRLSSKIGMFSSNYGRFDTLLGFLVGVRGVLPRIKIENRGLPNCWKSIEIVNPSTTDLFLLFVFF